MRTDVSMFLFDSCQWFGHDMWGHWTKSFLIYFMKISLSFVSTIVSTNRNKSINIKFCQFKFAAASIENALNWIKAAKRGRCCLDATFLNFININIMPPVVVGSSSRWARRFHYHCRCCCCLLIKILWHAVAKSQHE